MRGGKKIGVCAFACILTPSPYGHSPYIPCRNTGGEVEMYSSFAFAPILYRTPRHAAGYGRGGGEYSTKLRRDKTVQCDTFNPLPLLIADEIGGSARRARGLSLQKHNTLSFSILRRRDRTVAIVKNFIAKIHVYSF